MATTNRMIGSLGSVESYSNEFTEVDDWLAKWKEDKLPLFSIENNKLNVEIHLAITAESLEYVPSLCDRLFTLYRDVQKRSFVLQFLPSFITTYYDVLYQHTTKLVDDHAKDVRTTIDTFFVGLYNLSVLDENCGAKTRQFRIPNLTLPSIYHMPNADFYSPAPLTQRAVSKHEKKSEFIHLPTLTPFDIVNATTREQILWFLLIQYGMNVSLMDAHSCQSYIHMSNKLLGQGFSFGKNGSTDPNSTYKSSSVRRIHISSRVMTEILATLFHFKANSTAKEVSECMQLLKQRAEYELYADVILMTESMSFLLEIEAQRTECQDTIGIEIELPPTVDMVKQRRSATTARSMKSRQRPQKHHYQPQTAIDENDLQNDKVEHLNCVPALNDANLIHSTVNENRFVLDSLQNTQSSDFDHSLDANQTGSNEENTEISLTNYKSQLTSSLEMTMNVGSSIGLDLSSPSPTSRREYKPVSLASTQTYFRTLQQQPQRASSPNSQQVQTILHHNPNLPISRTSSMKQGDKGNIIATVRFVGINENRTNVQETYL